MEMKRFAVLFFFLIFPLSTVLAQKADVALVFGGTSVSDAKASVPCPPGVICSTPLTERFKTGHQFYWEGAAAYRFANTKPASFYVELPVVGIPSQRLSLNGSFPLSTLGHINSIFVTPSLKVKFLPKAPISPFASVGGGWARYGVNSSTTNKGALQFGGGLDVKTLISHLALRFEVRDVVTSNPNFGLRNASVHPGFNRHNVLAGGGPVFTF
jgi:hypothetical protein